MSQDEEGNTSDEAAGHEMEVEIGRRWVAQKWFWLIGSGKQHARR